MTSSEKKPVAVPARLNPVRRMTDARVLLGRSGSGLPTSEHLRFSLDHARARDAVWSEIDETLFRDCAKGLDLPSMTVESRAPDRAAYVRRPDLGREISPETEARFQDIEADVALIVADGLSAAAVNINAAPLLETLIPDLQAHGLIPSPVIVVRQGRVAVGDQVGQAIGATVSVVLIGERPGLSAADSLGVYLTFQPRPGTPDSRRNCLSNIRSGGLSPEDAAKRTLRLIEMMIRHQVSGVSLKEEATDIRRLNAQD